MEKKPTSPVVTGLIISLLLIVISIVGYLTGIDQQSWFRWVSSIVFCVAIIIACINYSNQKNNIVTYGNVFAFGFKTAAVVTCITVIYIALFFVIFPEAKEKALEIAREQMAKNPNMTEEQVDKGMEITRKYFNVFTIGGVLFGSLVIGIIAALIGAAFAKKRSQPTPFENA